MPPLHHGGLPQLVAPPASGHPTTHCNACTGTAPPIRTALDGHGNKIQLVEPTLCRGHLQQSLLLDFPTLTKEWAADRDRARQERVDYGLDPRSRPQLPGLDPATMLTVVTSPAAAASVAALFGTP